MSDKPELDEILREEAEHANRDYTPHAANLEMQPQMFMKYRSPRQLHDWRQLAAMLLGDLHGKALLDYGCGMGEEAVYFAKLGARVTAIDISDVGVTTLRRRAEYNQLEIDAREMRCDHTSFAPSSFDVVHGLGILHHVGIERGLREVWRVLRPGGIGVFLEPLGDSTPIEAVKTFLMTHARFLGEFDHVTDHEHNLTWEEIENSVTWFADATVFPYHLLYRLKRFIPDGLHDLVRRIDHATLSVLPRLRHFAGAVVIRVQKQELAAMPDLLAMARKLEPDPRMVPAAALAASTTDPLS